ncbi:CVNH domain-containing protein [Phenylobacterium koreense]|uniref:Cyanovirin-N domain-containing protein n=1 Tax=Phenylobacterium koreense TaxID=266125 RepID=A0ABV2ELE4_9CAUL
MKSYLVAAIAAAAFGGQAQAQVPQWGGGWGGIPPGSYQQTCRDIRVSGPTLTATCRDSRGRWTVSSMRFDQCRGDIQNNNGRLRCSNSGAPGWGGAIPNGTFQQSCRDARVSGNVLTATCPDNRGRWTTSSIRFRDCRFDIRNDNGRLACEFGGPGGGWGPGGGFGRSQLDLFSGPDFQNPIFSTSSEITNLPRQFNDRAMSLRIQGRGVWQVCVDSNFRGRCQTFDRDVRDLRQFGLGQAITSMRQVR